MCKRRQQPIQNWADYQIIIRAIHDRGASQQAFLAELEARGLWLSPEQREQAGLPAKGAR